ncbi:MAG TPA: cyclic nucleotide-binding domain-containing protein [Terracidiphilus sp.]|nr:cyclic nucleotide-binding domain-containing protein [Terracidiphilus sp.]
MKLDSSSFGADRELMEALELHSTPLDCETPCVLFTQGEPPSGLYVLKAGTVVLAMTSPQGREIFRIPVDAGSVLGLPALIGNQPYSLTATAARGARLCFISIEDFSRIMVERPTLSLSILRVLAAEVRTARYAITES